MLRLIQWRCDKSYSLSKLSTIIAPKDAGIATIIARFIAMSGIVVMGN